VKYKSKNYFSQVIFLYFWNPLDTGGLTGRLKLKQKQKINKLSDRPVSNVRPSEGSHIFIVYN